MEQSTTTTSTSLDGKSISTNSTTLDGSWTSGSAESWHVHGNARRAASMVGEQCCPTSSTTNAATTSTIGIPASTAIVYIPSAAWTGAKRGYVFTTRQFKTGYYKDALVESSQVHQDASDRADIKAAEDAKKAKAIAEREAAEQEANRLEKEADELERKISEKPPLEAYAERFALAQAQAKQQALKEKLLKMERSLMIENGTAEQEEEEVTIENEEDEDDVDDDEIESALTPGQQKAKEIIIQQESLALINKTRLENGESELSLEEWEENKKKEKLLKQQEWFKQENERRKLQNLSPLDFDGWLALESEKKKEKKRAKARERGKHAVNPEVAGLELAIVPGQMWAAARTGIPEHLPEAVKAKIMKKLMDEVIMRPSPEQEERLRIEQLEKEKAQLEQSEECKTGVLASLDEAVAKLEELAMKLPAVQRRRRQLALLAKQNLNNKTMVKDQEESDITSKDKDEGGGDVKVEEEEEDDEMMNKMSEEEIKKALEGPIMLDDATFEVPKHQDSLAARLYQSSLQTKVRSEALQANPANPMMGMMAATAAVTALSTASPTDTETYTKLGKIAYEKLQKRSAGMSGENEKNSETNSDDESDVDGKKRKKHRKSSKKHDRRSRSNSYDRSRSHRSDSGRHRDDDRYYRRDSRDRYDDRYDDRRRHRSRSPPRRSGYDDRRRR